MLMQSIHRHASLKSLRASNKKASWITNHLCHEMHGRNYLKRKTLLDRDQASWDQYKRARNQINNEIKKAQRKYLIDNLEFSKSNPKKTWQLINEQSSRHSNKTGIIPEMKVDKQTITEPLGMAGDLNLHFSNIGGKLTSGIPAST